MLTGTNTIVWLWFLFLKLLFCSTTNFGVIASSLILLKASRTFPKTSQTVQWGVLFMVSCMSYYMKLVASVIVCFYVWYLISRLFMSLTTYRVQFGFSLVSVWFQFDGCFYKDVHLSNISLSWALPAWSSKELSQFWPSFYQLMGNMGYVVNKLPSYWIEERTSLLCTFPHGRSS